MLLDTVLYVTVALDYTRIKKKQSCEVASYHQYTLKHTLFSINPFQFVYQIYIAAQSHEFDSG